MKDTYILFRTAPSMEEADEIAVLLKKEGIESEIIELHEHIDSAFLQERLENDIEIHIREEDLKKAEKMVAQLADTLLKNVDEEHYLFSYSNEELMDILVKKNEWSEYDIALTRKILVDRNVKVDTDAISEQREERLDTLAKPEGGQAGWIIAGYLFAFLGGILGLVIGSVLWQSKKRLPNGRKTFAYDEYTRKHGGLIVLISAIILPITFALKMMGQLSILGM